MHSSFLDLFWYYGYPQITLSNNREISEKWRSESHIFLIAENKKLPVYVSFELDKIWRKRFASEFTAREFHGNRRSACHWLLSGVNKCLPLRCNFIVRFG
jgi:hypothetical protein